ncbi:MAG TPA: hypothetical protein VFP19_08560 [Candidatus Limnocylindrales bacterium]|nr:hypothetical protein [Candidatus Limnocylindrales bacterium]
MKRAIALVVVGLLAASCGSPANSSSDSALGVTSLIRMYQHVGKNPEGIAVNPVTHKAYVFAEQDIEGDDNYALFVLDDDVLAGLAAPQVIPVPNENEYLAIDSVRNLIYVPTKFRLEAVEPPDSGGDESGGETDADVDVPAPITPPPGATYQLGTLTVVDGNTNAVIGSWKFDFGFEPEGVAVDLATGIVYVGAKAPEGESANDDYCAYGTEIPDVGSPEDLECWTAGTIFAFSVDPTNTAAPFTLLKTIPAGDDPESVVFQNGMIYAANEDDGTVTIATAVNPDGSGGILLTDVPRALEAYSLRVFSQPNPLACLENQYEADKMAAGIGSVFITDDRSRVAKITGATVVATADVPGATVCEYVPNSDGGGKNSANNIAVMQKGNRALVYVVSEQNTVAIFDPADLTLKSIVTVPSAVHLDAIAVDPTGNRVWITDEDLHAVFVLQGACATGTGNCNSLDQ